MEKRNQPQKKGKAGKVYQHSSQDKNYRLQDNSDRAMGADNVVDEPSWYTNLRTMNGARPKSNSYADASYGFNFLGEYSKKTLTPESQILKRNIYSSVSAFTESNNNFSDVYIRWLFIRKLTIEKLKTLVKDLHNDQLEYNKAKRTCREIGQFSRGAKCEPDTFGFIAGLSALLSDVASGVTSIVQAVNVDEYTNKFKEIMDIDAKITKDLYEARTRCVVKYKGIEEITRKHHSSTFDSTVSRISNDLEVKHLTIAVNNAYENDDVSEMLSVIGNFVESNCQLEKMQNICYSIKTYTDENPAALEVLSSAGRAVRGAFDLAYIDGKKSKNMSYVARASNHLMMMEDRREIQRLDSMINYDSSQSKLEEKIQGAINSLEFEMDQFVDAYN